MDQKNYAGFAHIRQILLEDDVSFISEVLLNETYYDFSSDVRARMDALKLSANELGKRCFVSHTIVNRWLSGKARPNGKERMKELGMALRMDEDTLNEFLLLNCYTRLYAKNPLDDVCKLMIREHRGSADIVQKYREYIEKYKVKQISLPENRISISTSNLSKSLAMIDSGTDFDAWLEKYMENFAASDKTILPDRDLIRFVLLYVGEASINEMYVTGELPVTLRNMLYPLIGDKELALRGLRNKLVVFGLYNNMTEEELDLMLSYAKLLPISETGAKIDTAVLGAVRCGHERYPYYEYTSMQQRTADLMDIIASKETAGQVVPPIYEKLLYEFRIQLENAAERAAYYDRPGKKGEMERLFEIHYTDYSDKGLTHYVRDLLEGLIDGGALTQKEAADYLELLKTED